MSTDPQRREKIIREPSYFVPSLTIFGCIVVGIAAFLGGIVALADDSANRNPYIGAGICWLAAAVSFGFLANAIYRK